MCREESYCPVCEFPEDIEFERRDFLRTAGGAAAAVAVGGAGLSAEDKSAPKKRKPRPAEELVKELHSTLSEEQKKTLVLPWDHGGKRPTRRGMFNRAYKNQRIQQHYSKAQQDLISRTLKAICNGSEGYEKISRNGKFDSSGSLLGCGSHIFGDPSSDGKFAWLFTGHHLTVRCDGNSEPGAAFGGPMYYGHIAPGYSAKNVYRFQTKRVEQVFEALNSDQRTKAVAPGTPGEQAKSVRFRPKAQQIPGIGYADLSKDQKGLVATAMRDILSPFRKEDGDEVMQIIKANGGMEKLHLAFYKDQKAKDNVRWSFWRIEGPGFVWNFRVLPHVHCFVNISSKFA